MQVYSNLTLPHKVAIVPVVLRFTVDLASIESYSTDHALANHENASALFSTEINIQGEIKRMAPLNLRSGDYIFAQIASNQLMSCLL